MDIIIFQIITRDLPKLLTPVYYVNKITTTITIPHLKTKKISGDR